MKLLIIVMLMQLLAGCVVTDKIKQIQTGFEWRGVKNASAWQSAGVKTPEEAKKWIEVGIDSTPCNNNFRCEGSYVGNWIKRGITSSKAAKSWKDSSLKAYEIFGYIDAGVKSIESAKKWKKVDCGSYAKDCIKAGIKNPDAVKKWFDAGFNKKEIIQYVTFGVTSLKQAMAWKKLGGTEHQIYIWKKKGVTFDEAKDILGKNIAWNMLKTDDVHMWKKTGLTPDEASVWIKAEIKDAPHWIKSGVTNINDVKKWIKAGFPDGYKWNYNDFKKLDDAKRWKKLGVSLDLAYKLKNQAHLTSRNLIKSCGTVLTSTGFMSSNPYKHVGKCVSTCIRVQQILSSNKVFAQTGYKPLRMISATAPNNLTDDFVVNKLACGVYKIQDAEKFNLSDGRTVTGNSFKMLGRHDF